MTLCNLCGNTDFSVPGKCLLPKTWPGQILNNWVCCATGDNILVPEEKYKKSLLRKAALLIVEKTSTIMNGHKHFKAVFNVDVVSLVFDDDYNYFQIFMSSQGGLLTCAMYVKLHKFGALMTRSLPATHDHAFFISELEATLEKIVSM